MHRRATLVYDDYKVGTPHTFTSTGLLELLGAFDDLDLEVWLDHVNQSDSFHLTVEHSADGNHYLPVSFSGTPNLTMALTVAGPKCGWVHVGWPIPLLAFVRLNLDFALATTSALVRVVAHQRDREKHPNIKPLPMPILGGKLQAPWPYQPPIDPLKTLSQRAQAQK